MTALPRLFEKYSILPSANVEADPAAGAEVSFTIAAGNYLELRSVVFQLVTTAGGSARQVTLLLDDGTNVFARITTPVTQAASLTYNYTFATAGVNASALANTDVLVTLPSGLVLGAGFRVRTSTLNIAGGDNYGAPVSYGLRYKL